MNLNCVPIRRLSLGDRVDRYFVVKSHQTSDSEDDSPVFHRSGLVFKMIELTYIDIVISAEAESWNGIDPTRRGRRIIRKSKSGHVLFLQSSLKISTNKMSPISCLNYKNCTSL